MKRLEKGLSFDLAVMFKTRFNERVKVVVA